MRIGILGYGNLAKGVECAIGQNDDLELTAVFTRRNPESVKGNYTWSSCIQYSRYFRA